MTARAVLVIGVLLVVAMAAVAQLDRPAEDDGAKPWEEWQPPAVEMPDPNAFDLYELAWALRAELAGTEDADDFARPEECTVDELAAMCDLYGPVFRLLEEAVAGEARFPLLADPAQAMPYFADVRRSARMFAGRSLLYDRVGHALGAALDAVACVHVGADASTQGTLIAGLVGIACQSIGQRRLEAVIPELDTAEALAVANALRRAMAERVTLADALRGEEILARLMFKRHLPVFEGTAEVTAEQIAPDLAELMRGMDPGAVWRELGTLYGGWIEEAGKPWYARSDPPTPENPVLATVAVGMGRAPLRFAANDTRLNVEVAALAAQTWLSEHGSLPTSLDVLVPDYLPEVPHDPFVDAPLRSGFREPVTRAHPAAEREPQGARMLTIYSVGPDGDDDGGLDIGTSVEANSDGDIAFTMVTE